MGDRQAKPSAVNLFPFVGVDRESKKELKRKDGEIDRGECEEQDRRNLGVFRVRREGGGI